MKLILSTDPILHTKGKKALKAKMAAVVALRDELKALSVSVSGYAIAGPQIGDGYSWFYVNRNHINQIPSTFVFNPKIVDRSAEGTIHSEGCLSYPGRKYMANRWNWIDVEYTDEKGNKVTRTLSGKAAQIFQHEVDHVNGITVADALAI